MSGNGARRITQAEILDRLLDATSRTTGEQSSVRLTRNSRGTVQIEVLVRTGEHGVETVEQASERARAVYDAIAELYPVSVEGEA